uniref:Uncharacterized protein n=1 Tax=Triticum urartu TaxID=4572 RepID=A0A8R7QW60_TRIUA
MSTGGRGDGLFSGVAGLAPHAGKASPRVPQGECDADERRRQGWHPRTSSRSTASPPSSLSSSVTQQTGVRPTGNQWRHLYPPTLDNDMANGLRAARPSVPMLPGRCGPPLLLAQGGVRTAWFVTLIFP